MSYQFLESKNFVQPMVTGEVGAYPMHVVLLVVLEMKFGIGIATILCENGMAFLAQEAVTNIPLAIEIRARVKNIIANVI